MSKISVTHAQFDAMQAAICKAVGGMAEAACRVGGHQHCKKVANAALRALRKAASDA